MYIENLHLINYRSFEELRMSFHEKLTVIVGGNGVGKTSILESLAIACGTFFLGLDNVKSASIKPTDARYSYYRIGSGLDSQQQFPVSILAKGSVGGKALWWRRSLMTLGGKTTYGEASQLIRISKEYRMRLMEGDDSLILPIIAYYGTGRMWDYHREKPSEATRKSSRTNGYIDCLDGTANIKLMLKWFQKMTVQKYQRYEQGRGVIPEYEAVCEAIAHCFALATGYQKVKVQYNMDINELVVSYIDFQDNFVQLPLNQLSDGYKCTMSLVADIAYRMAVLNPQLLNNVLSETPGIVMIDEVDLHLHPEWQQHVLGDLQEIFPNVQFIVSTHAPAIINTVQGESLRILKDNQVFGSPDETYGKDVNTIVRAIMEADERPKDIKKMFEMFYSAMDQGDLNEAENILFELEKILGQSDVEAVACRTRLDLEKLF